MKNFFNLTDEFINLYYNEIIDCYFIILINIICTWFYELDYNIIVKRIEKQLLNT